MRFRSSIMCMPKLEEDVKHEQVSNEDDVEEEVEINKRTRMLLIINDLLKSRREELIIAIEFKMICPHQEDFVFFVCFECDDIAPDRAVQVLREIVNSAVYNDHC